MRISLPHLVVGGLSVAAAGLVTLSLWLVVLGTAGLTAAAAGALLTGRRKPRRPLGWAEAGSGSGSRT